jgi:hypothetical protein
MYGRRRRHQLIRLLHEEVSVDDVLEQHRKVLEYERFVKTHTWAEVESAYPDSQPTCECVICMQLEVFSDKLVTIMRERRFQDNAPETNEPRLETLMHDLLAFSEAAEEMDFSKPRPIRTVGSSGL